MIRKFPSHYLLIYKTLSWIGPVWIRSPCAKWFYLSLPGNFLIFTVKSSDKYHFPSLSVVGLKLIKGSEKILKEHWDYCPSICCVLLAGKCRELRNKSNYFDTLLSQDVFKRIDTLQEGFQFFHSHFLFLRIGPCWGAAVRPLSPEGRRVHRDGFFLPSLWPTIGNATASIQL